MNPTIPFIDHINYTCVNAYVRRRSELPLATSLGPPLHEEATASAKQLNTIVARINNENPAVVHRHGERCAKLARTNSFSSPLGDIRPVS